MAQRVDGFGAGTERATADFPQTLHPDLETLNPMKQHLTKIAAEWFNDRDAWSSFMELVDLNVDIQDHWLDEGSKAIRKHFHDNPSPGWRLVAWDGYIRDTWWFLEDFGPDSVGIGYGWKFHLCFGVKSGRRVDHAALAELISTDAYRPLVTAFGRKDPSEKDPSKFDFPLHQYGDFSFGIENDHNVTGYELAWFAGHRTESFAKQAAAKIQAFTHDPAITDLLKKLNAELMKG